MGRYGATVVKLDDYRPDERFVSRVQELLAGRSLEDAWALCGIHPNQMRDILKGKTTQPTFNMLRRLAQLQPWATPTWVATGHDEAEEAIDTIEQLHAWDVRVARERMRYFEIIIEKQKAAMAAKPLPAEDAAFVHQQAKAVADRQGTLHEQALGEAPAAGDQRAS